jgi:rubrerythrin
MSPVSQTVLDGLNEGIKAELAAYVFYMKGMNTTKEQRLKDLLATLAAEEKDHYKILERQYDNLVRSEIWAPYNDIMLQPGLPNIDEQVENVHNEYIDELTEQTSPMRILEIALMLEKRARDHYAGMADKVDDPKGKDMFNYLSKFENGHVNKITRMMKEFEN